MSTNDDISDQDAADALRYGSKSGQVPTHSAMQTADDPEADEDQGDFFDNEERD